MVSRDNFEGIFQNIAKMKKIQNGLKLLIFIIFLLRPRLPILNFPKLSIFEKFEAFQSLLGDFSSDFWRSFFENFKISTWSKIDCRLF